MRTPAEILVAVCAAGGRLEPAGDNLRVLLPRNCPAQLKASIREHKSELLGLLNAKPLRPLTTSDEFTSAMLRVFPGAVRVYPDPSLAGRLAAIEAILARRDPDGRIDYTRSEIESCIIGLRSFASDPAAAALLNSLREAKKRALTWRALMQRTGRRNRAA